MGQDRRCGWDCCRRASVRGNDQGPRAREGGHAPTPYRQGLPARADVSRELDSHFGLPFQGADLSLLRRDELRNLAAISGSAAEPEIERPRRGNTREIKA